MENQEYYEKCLLGTWIRGNNTNDIKLYDKKLFMYYPQIYQALNDGAVGVEGVRSKVDMKAHEIAQIMVDANRGVSEYNSAKAYFGKMQIREMLEDLSKDSSLDKKKIESATEELERIINNSYSDRIEPTRDWVDKYQKEMDRRAISQPMNYGMPTLDRMTGGLRAGELTSIGARPGVGKSAFLLQSALKLSQYGRVLFFPLEMTVNENLQRIMLRNTDIESDHLRTGKMAKEEWDIFAMEIDKIHELENTNNLMFFENKNRLMDISNAIDTFKPKVVMIDQLTQLKDDKDFKDIRTRYSHMTASLKRMALDKGVSIVLACQINRSAEELPPTMASLKESGSIEEDSDNVILIHKLSETEIEKFNIKKNDGETPVMIRVSKQRNGGTGDITAYFLQNKFAFYEGAR